MVGVIADTRRLVTRGFKSEGDLIALLGETLDDLAASEYAQTIAGLSTQQLIDNGVLPHVDLQAEKNVQQTVLALADECLIHSAHDCSDGGLAVTIAESCFSSLGCDAVGAEITLDNKGLSNEALLFGETPSRIVISFDAEHLDRVKAIAGNVEFQLIGKVTGKRLTVKNGETELLSSPIDQLENAWRDSLRTVLEPQ
jgi:phosphoribosylformylglycinamidine synthase subunit PurL